MQIPMVCSLSLDDPDLLLGPPVEAIDHQVDQAGATALRPRRGPARAGERRVVAQSSGLRARPRPLALYWFGRSDAVRDDVLRRTVSGGVTVNDTLMHIAHDNLPFGGVGESGWGAYHGEQGFLRFCHQKAVLVQSRWAMGSLFYPPYGARFDKIMGLLRRWL